jgi:hypothetical protein
MKRTSPLDHIEVPTPCPAEWDDMQGNERVRFCTHCARSVHNLSAMTRPEAMKLIAHTRGRVCVRYYRRPDGTLHNVAPLVQIQTSLRRASRLAASAFSAALTLSASAAAQQPAANARADTRVAVQAQPARSAARTAAGSGGYGSIAGTITDPTGVVIPNASVTLTHDHDGAQTTQTDAEGRFQFSAQPVGGYLLKVESSGFTSVNRPVFVQAQQEVRADTMLPVGMALSGVMVIAPSEPLVAAAQDGDLNAVRALLAKGSDVNVLDKPTDKTALMAAAEDGSLELVQLLLGAGADVNARNVYGQTALMQLDADAKPELVRMLVTAGARVNVQDKDGDTALMNLARWGNADSLRTLVDAGAKVNARNHDGDTPLMLAAAQGELENVRVLLQAGADVNRRNKEGQTALQQARTNDNDEIVKLLIAYGSIVDPEEKKEAKDK